MPIIVSAGSGGNFTPAPAGAHQGVCVDVIDLGMVETEFQGVKKLKQMVRIVWELSAEMDDGRPFIASQRFTASLHEKAALRRFLESWRGKALAPEELTGFDLERLIGVNGILNIVHKDALNGSTYANIMAVSPIMPRMGKITPSGGYVRVKDRPGYIAPQTARQPEPEHHDREPGSDDDRLGNAFDEDPFAVAI